MAKNLLSPDTFSGSLSSMTFSNNFLFAGDFIGTVGSTTIQTDILKLNTVQVNIDPLAAAALATVKKNLPAPPTLDSTGNFVLKTK